MRRSVDKKKIILICLIILFAGSIASAFYANENNIWNHNAEKLRYSLHRIRGDAVIEDISEYIPFEWDTWYSFAPYTPKETIYDVIGYRWSRISETVNEGMNQIVFVKDGKVVCYLYGYPEYTKLGFDFGQYEGSYIKFSSDQKISFSTKISGDGIRYFRLIK